MAGTKNVATVTFKAETREFQAGINKANTSMGALRSELKLNAAEMKNVSNTTQKLKERQGLLQQQFKENKNKIENLNGKLEKAKKIYGENSNEVAKLKNQLNKAKTEEQNIQAEINKTSEQIKDNSKVVEKLSGAYDKAATASAAVVAGIVAIGGASIKAFSEVDDGADNIIKKTGAAGKAEQEFEEIYKEVAGETVGSFSDTGNALGEINTRFEFTGDKLKQATTDFMNFARVNDIDVVTAIQKVARYMGDASIESDKYKEVLDELTVAGQASGIAIDKLAEMCTTYGAPMRALGFDTKESIAIFASWEKAGVNTSIAFSGMKKAISNWGKAGLDGREEFKKTLEEIKKCPDIASATTKAIEVFGSKAGPDLADAIQGGRFEYQKMLDLVEGSAGTLDKTNANITDELDEVQMMFKKVKVGASEFGTEILKELSPTINKFADNIDEYTDKILEHKNEIITGIKTVGAVAGTIFVTNKIGKTVESINSIRKAVIALIPVRNAEAIATEGQAAAQTSLNAAMLINPATLWITSLTALAGCVYVATKQSKEMCETAKEAKTDFENLSNAVKKANDSANMQTQTADRLVERLEKICKSNGKVKKGYEDEAEAIKTELADAYGIQANLTNGQFENYNKLRKQIDKVIASKKAEAYLDANKENYSQAIQNQSKYIQKVQDTSKAIEEQKKKIAEIEQQGVVSTNNPYVADEVVYSAKLELAKKNLADLETTLQQQNNAYSSALNTISNYENLQVASVNGSASKINSALQNLIAGFQTAENTSRESLQQQVLDTKQNLDDIKAAYDAGTPGVTQASVNLAQSMYDNSVAEYKKAGGDLGDAAVSSIQNKLTEAASLPAWKKLEKFKKSGAGKSLPIPQIPGHADGGIYKKGAHLTWFAEKTKEYAIPINGSNRSKSLVLNAANDMGMLSSSKQIVESRVNTDISMRETNALLRLILNKNTDINIDGNKLITYTSTKRDKADGIRTALVRGGIAID